MIVYNKQGNEYFYESVNEAAQHLGVSNWTIKRRLEDGLFLFIGGKIPMRVRYADDETN